MSGKPVYCNAHGVICITLFVAALLHCGCGVLLKRHLPPAIPYATNPPDGMAVNVRARTLNQRGLKAYRAGNLLDAERLFREALDEDTSFGPAHNNLGQVYLARHQLYLAAWEFEYASSLMPELVEPIVNQGLAYETGEQIDRAAEIYEQAYRRDPTHPVAIASLVRARIKQDGDPNEIGTLLDELIMHDGRQRWVEWAKELRMTKYRNPTIDCEPCLDADETFPQTGELDEPSDEFYPTAPDDLETDRISPPVNELTPPLSVEGDAESDELDLPFLNFIDEPRPTLDGPLKSAFHIQSTDETLADSSSPTRHANNTIGENKQVSPVTFEADAIAKQIIEARK